MTYLIKYEYKQYLKETLRNIKYLCVRGHDITLNKTLYIKQIIFSRTIPLQDSYAKGKNSKPYKKCKKRLRRKMYYA